MKDVISILQSRIAKRSAKIHWLRESLCDCHDCVADGSFYDQEEKLTQQTKQQKEDKRILAEIIKLRRVAKVVKRQEAIMRALDSVYEPAEIELPKDFVELIRLGER